MIYNSRNYSILLNKYSKDEKTNIYNSRNYSILLNLCIQEHQEPIYNSRNYSILLNGAESGCKLSSTTVEIILYYLTSEGGVSRT